MSSTTDPPAAHGLLPRTLTGLAGIAWAACCAIPLLLGGGVLGGAGWVAAVQVMPGVAVVLAVVAVGTWRWAGRRRRVPGCSGGDDCGCGAPTNQEEPSVGVALKG